MAKDTDRDLAIAFTIYGPLSLFAAVTLFTWSLKRWPGNSRDGGFIILSLLASIILGAIWPVSVPAIWIIRSCVDSSWSCFGFNYPAWKAKKRAKKQLRAQEIEMDRMERAQQVEDNEETRRRNEEQEEIRKLEEAKERVKLKRDHMLGRGTAAGEDEENSSSSSSSASNHDNPEAVAGKSDAATRYWS